MYWLTILKKLNTWNEDISLNTKSYDILLKGFLHSGYISREHSMESFMVTPKV